MSKQARRKQSQAVQLLDQAVKRYKALVRSNSSHQPNADTSVATLERYVKRLRSLMGTPGGAPRFWSLLQKVHLRLLKHTLDLRN